MQAVKKQGKYCLLPLIVAILTVGICSASTVSDPTLQPITKDELVKLIHKYPIDSPQQMDIVRRASYSILTDVAYKEYVKLLETHKQDGYLYLLAGSSADSDYWNMTNPFINPSPPRFDGAYSEQLEQTAKTYLERAVQLLPQSAYTNATYGLFIYSRANQTSDGLKYMLKAVALAPGDAHMHNLLGDVYSNPTSSIYDPKRAEDELRTAIMIDPSFAEPHHNLAILFVNQNRYRDARRELDVYLGMAPKSFRTTKWVLALDTQIESGLSQNNALAPGKTQ